MKRREFIQFGLVASSLSVVPRFLYASTDHNHPAPHPSPAPAPTEPQEFDIEIEMFARESEAQLLAGAKTKTWKYSGRVVKGPQERITVLDNSYLGPILKLKKGEKVRVIFKNELPEASIIHWHGLDVPHLADGHPHNAIRPNETYVYEFEVLNRAGTYWYHPHPHGRTGFQVFQGLAGLLIIEDSEEQSLKLPRGTQDIPIVIQDRRFDENNQFQHVQSPHDHMMGVMGNKLFINGSADREWKLNPGSYRLRILNGSNARTYNLKWSDGRKLTVIGVDGGLLEASVEYENIFFGPAERVELLVDIKETDLDLALQSAPFVAGRGQTFNILNIKPEGEAKEFVTTPNKLTVIEKLNPKEAANYESAKVFELIPTREHGWTIDGHPYEMGIVTEKETCKLGTTEIWQFENNFGMPHPIHIHGSPFQVLERISGQFSGCMDLGWKDVVLLMPGDKVKLIKQFKNFTGDFIYHCHNLEHEDMSMMRDFRVIL